MISVLAYIGPGPGLSMLGALVGLVVTILGSLFAVLFWPMRSMLRRRKEAAEGESSTSKASDTPDDDDEPNDEEKAS